MDFKQLEAFAQVVRLGSFSKAAEMLHLTQPTVSAHIRTLENELNTSLLVRTPHGAHPTEAGKKLFYYAEELLTLRERAMASCRVKTDDYSGELAVVASSVPYQYVLPTALSAFREQYPRVCFQLLRRDSIAAEQAVLSGEAELGLSGTCGHLPALIYKELCRDELVVITPATPLYTQRKARAFTAQELLQESCIFREEGSGTRREAEAYLKRQGVQLKELSVVATMDNPDAVKSAVCQGLGISIVSKLSAEDFEQLGLLLSFQLGECATSRPIYLVRHRRRPLSALAKKFEKYLQSLHCAADNSSD